MPQAGIFDRTVALLEKVMDLRAQNQQTIASNIANNNTPGYSAARLEFEDRLREAVGRNSDPPAVTHPRHIPIGGGEIATVKAEVIRTPAATKLGDGNSVDLDREMVKLAENQILYEAAVQMINKKLSLLKYVAQDR